MSTAGITAQELAWHRLRKILFCEGQSLVKAESSSMEIRHAGLPCVLSTLEDSEGHLLASSRGLLRALHLSKSFAAFVSSATRLDLPVDVSCNHDCSILSWVTLCLG